MAEVLGIDQATLSQQLKNLRYMNIVKTRRDGHCVIYSLKDQSIKEVFKSGCDHAIKRETKVNVPEVSLYEAILSMDKT